jgi:site-specific recombinase XerD
MKRSFNQWNMSWLNEEQKKQMLAVIENDLRDEVIVEEGTPHSPRHTYACSLINNSVELQEVTLLMGHSSLDSTARYVQPGENELQQAVVDSGVRGDDGSPDTRIVATLSNL